jgi:hypothetical protein
MVLNDIRGNPVAKKTVDGKQTPEHMVAKTEWRWHSKIGTAFQRWQVRHAQQRLLIGSAHDRRQNLRRDRTATRKAFDTVSAVATTQLIPDKRECRRAVAHIAAARRTLDKWFAVYVSAATGRSGVGRPKSPTPDLFDECRQIASAHHLQPRHLAAYIVEYVEPMLSAEERAALVPGRTHTMRIDGWKEHLWRQARRTTAKRNPSA